MGPPAGGLLGGLGGGLLSQQFGLQSGFVVLTLAFVLAAIVAWRTPEGW
jgi:predicted MFS family arabinose efflux permease